MKTEPGLAVAPARAADAGDKDRRTHIANLYLGVPLGVECAWPAPAVEGGGEYLHHRAATAKATS